MTLSKRGSSARIRCIRMGGSSKGESRSPPCEWEEAGVRAARHVIGWVSWFRGLRVSIA